MVTTRSHRAFDMAIDSAKPRWENGQRPIQQSSLLRLPQHALAAILEHDVTSYSLDTEWSRRFGRTLAIKSVCVNFWHAVKLFAYKEVALQSRNGHDNVLHHDTGHKVSRLAHSSLVSLFSGLA